MVVGPGLIIPSADSSRVASNIPTVVDLVVKEAARSKRAPYLQDRGIDLFGILQVQDPFLHHVMDASDIRGNSATGICPACAP